MTEKEFRFGFDRNSAIECADSFAEVSGLCCTLSDSRGKILHRAGNPVGCHYCPRSSNAEEPDNVCVSTHLYGLMQAERFGGKYIYFCPSGLTWFVSPLSGEEENPSMLCAGPFRIVSQDETADNDSEFFTPEQIAEIPSLTPERTRHLQTLLHMGAGYLNRTGELLRLMENNESTAMAGQIGSLLQTLKSVSDGEEYPFDTERKLMQAIREGRREESRRLLNDILGFIFFQSGGEYETIRARCCELVVLLSRASVEAGGDPAQIFGLNSRYITEVYSIRDVEKLCVWLTGVMNRFMDITFRFSEIGHADVIRKAVDYMRRHCSEKVSLEAVASSVYLSPTYFSRTFKEETGIPFSACLNRVRVEKARTLLLQDELKLVDICGMVGFDDQSYFTKVFRKYTGVTPGKFREMRGQIREAGFKPDESPILR